MHSAVQTAAVTIISYKPLSNLNFARYTQHYGSYMPSSPLGSYKPLTVQYGLVIIEFILCMYGYVCLFRTSALVTGLRQSRISSLVTYTS